MTIVSGIQPSGKLHVGNELGAVRKWLELQAADAHQCFFFIADWHSLTEQYDPKEKAAQSFELAAELLALGLDPDRVTLFRQSDLPEHMELAWYLACVTPVSELQRMTQFKDKTTSGETTNSGLFTYPILMTADILAYATGAPVGVPVGDDQRQHLELTNEIARRFHLRYGEMFPGVRGVHSPTPRIMSLRDPSKKMSKSAGAEHCLFLDDEPDTVRKKIAAAVTDSAPDSSMSPGVATLFTLLEAYGSEEEILSFRAAHDSGSLKYSELKPRVAETFISAHEDFRKNKQELMDDPRRVNDILAQGAETARAVAVHTLNRVRHAVGIR
jgi:tryptophanyl-tRNA synthetase